MTVSQGSAQIKPAMPGPVLPVERDSSAEATPSSDLSQTPSSVCTPASTRLASDASEEPQVLKQKQTQQSKVAQQKRQLYEKKFEVQMRSPPKQRLRRNDKSAQDEIAGLAALRQKGQALLSAIARGDQPEHRNRSERGDRRSDGFGVPMTDQLQLQLLSIEQRICHATPQGHADNRTVPLVLSSSPVQQVPSPYSPYPTVHPTGPTGPCILSSEPVHHPNEGTLFQQQMLHEQMEMTLLPHGLVGESNGLGLAPERSPGLASASGLPTLLANRAGPRREKMKPSMAVEPPPGLEAPWTLPEPADWLQSAEEERIAEGWLKVAEEPRKVEADDLASFFAAPLYGQLTAEAGSQDGKDVPRRGRWGGPKILHGKENSLCCKAEAMLETTSTFEASELV